jgi:peroxiredoxin/outer membrane lipoprotein-sorting protein
MFKMRMKNVLAVAFVLASMVISCASQDQNRPYTIAPASGAIAVLRQVAETYKNLKSYHFEGRYAWEQATESMGSIDETKSEELFVSAAIKPDRLRIESKNANFSVALVYDGKTKWVYASGANEYTKTEVAPAKSATRLPAVDPRVYLARAANLLVGYTSVADRVREAKIAGEETLEIGGRRVDCLVIEVYYLRLSTVSEPIPPTRKLWVDKSRNVVLRENQRIEVRTPQGKTVTTKATYVFTTARLGEQVPETLFTFVPPERAKEVAELTPLPEHAIPPKPDSPARATLAGKDAIAFSLKDLDGNQVDLQSLKDKVVLLDFWASWCGPCVRELPHIEKLHRDFKDRGLVVLGVNDDEAEVARAFLKKNGYTFTNLVDEGREVSMKYRVSGVPQVLIIGREGKIKWHKIGYSPGREAQLRNAVEMVLKGVDPPAPFSPRAGGAIR